ncbi:MAG: DNA cytosine methyltransferase [Syntrophomonadaceae bacterium]|nr:DNA cytosine methyltransferase [Syntrophomonadaceae bacterium]
MKKYSVLHLFSGIGGAALGFQEAVSEYRGMVGGFRTLAGIDCDLEACQDFEALTGSPAVCMDLFTRDQYISFHGQEPPDNWQEVTPRDLLEASGREYPDVVFLSPPCKGFSGLLPSAKAQSEKYLALNRLVVRGLQLVMDAYIENLPAVIMMENVPRITSRGKFLLKQVKSLLGSHGYVFHEGTHCCGELGGLGQRRKRYLLIARLPEKMPSFIYHPPKQKLKSIGDVIGPLPLPDDPTMGPMHRSPRLQWKTWVRLALIRAGGDWRDLEDCGDYGIEYIPRGGGSFGVQDWDMPSNTVTGNAKVNGSNASNIADPRTGFKDGTHRAIYRVVAWDEPGPTDTGALRPNNGAISITDPRLDYSPRPGAFRVLKWDDAAPTVTGSIGVGRSNSISGIEDPRLTCKPRSGSYGVQAWDETAKTVIGAGEIHSGSAAVADPRIPKDTEVLDPPPIIISLDGTWHRPLTTYELAILQGFPKIMSDSKPFYLTGSSDSRWRERIGNAVPPPTAKSIGEEILISFLASEFKNFFRLSVAGIWVNNGVQQHYEMEGYEC